MATNNDGTTTSACLKDDNSISITALLPTPPVFQEMIIIPSEGISMFLTKKQAEELYDKTQKLNDAMDSFINAKSDENAGEYDSSMEDLDIALLMVTEDLSKEDAKEKAKKADRPAVLAKGNDKLSEIIAFGKQKYLIAPTKFLSDIKNTDKKRKNVFSFTKDEDYVEDDALKSWRDEEGNLNKKKIKESFTQIKTDVKASWNLAKKTGSGQIPSRVLTKISSPLLAAFISEEDYKTFDTWVENFNKNTNISWNNKKKQKEKLIEILDKGDKFSEDDGYVVLRMVRDIWGKKNEDSSETEYTEFSDKINSDINYQPTSLSEQEQNRTNLKNEIEDQEVPPVMWDASAGAQIMRYSYGNTCKADFDLLKKGKVTFQAKSEADLALAEGKAEINGYFPNDKGFELGFSIKVKKEKYVWEKADITDTEPSLFFFNSSFFNVSAISSLIKNLATQEKLSPIFTNKSILLRFIGHTDETGTGAYNQKLSEFRALAAFGFIQKDIASWHQMFHLDQYKWGNEEIQYMRTALYLMENNPDFFDLAYVAYTPNETLEEFNAKFVTNYWDDFVLGLDSGTQSFLFPGKGYQSITQQVSEGMSLPSLNAFNSPQIPGKEDPNKLKLWQLIYTYITKTTEYLSKIHGATSIKRVFSFNSIPVAGMGEKETLPGTSGRDVNNRRVEMISYVINDSKTEIEKVDEDINLGYMRVMMQGFVSAWSGANISVAANVNIDCEKGMLKMIGGKEEESKETKQNSNNNEEDNSTQVADTSFSAYVGVKAEAGVKASLDWKKPDSTNKEIQEFNPLGSIGYTVTGMAGAGIEGEFKIGFDRTSGRFQVKMKIKAAWGFGFGGGFSFSVGVNDLWQFVVLVHEKLLSKDFCFIDVFETGFNKDGSEDESKINVYELFNAWNVEMLKKGCILEAGLAFAAESTLQVAIETLKNVDELLMDWRFKKQDVSNLNKLLESINTTPDIIKRLTPETKGRILYLLTQHKTSLFDDFFNKGVIFDRNHNYEEAAINLITKGMASFRDWQETLEHMADFNSENNTYDPYIDNGTQGKEEKKTDLGGKAKRYQQNLTWLRNYLLVDKKDWDTVEKFVNNLH